MSEGSVDDRRPEPDRPPDLWLPPTAGGPSAPPASWRQPPGWAAPPPWQQPPTSSPVPPPSPLTTALRAGTRARHPVRPVLFAVLFLPLLLLMVVGLALGYRTEGDRSPAPDTSPSRTLVPSAWDVPVARLRPDLDHPAYVPSFDGTFDQAYVVAAGGRWLTMTSTYEQAGLELHALDPATGSTRWSRPLDGGLCTTEASKAGLLCASVLRRDPATGLGTRWELHLVDPRTGLDRATRTVDGWFSAVHWTGSVFVALEQREPAPHAVVRAFGATDLADAWTRDLAGVPGQAELFSQDKVVRRVDQHPGVALDRPRLRDVGSGLLAVWAGQRTAFLDGSDGRLVMMPHCSRLVDDGARLWCNELDGASAYSYAGRPLVRVRGPRLAFPDDDGRGLDRNRPVFLDDDGAAVTVNPTTGDVGQPYTPPGRGSAYGSDTMPSSATVGARTFVLGGAGAVLLDDHADHVAWIDPSVTVSDPPVLLGADRVLLGAGDLTVLDLASGAPTARLRVAATYAVAVGGHVAGVGLETLSLLRL